MSIKQIGGVFGRNPTFNDVTIEGQLTFDGDIDINSDLKVDGELEVTGEILANGGITVGNKKVNLGSTGGAQLTLASGAITVTASNHQLLNEGGAANDDLDTINGGTSGDILILSAASNGQDISVKNGTGNIVLSVASGDCTLGNIKDKIILIYQGSAWYEVSRSINAGGATTDFTVSGNLVIGTSGKGIDFSATAGTGTSELLDDYEEGDWTPIYKTSGTNYDSIVYNFQYGTYIKIGQLVWVSFQLRTTSVTVGSASGNIRLGGLPFTVGSGNADDAFSPNAIHTNFASGAHGVSSPVNGTIESQLMDSAHSIASAATIATGANGNWLQGNIIYVAS
jgi:hypothetical protein